MSEKSVSSSWPNPEASNGPYSANYYHNAAGQPQRTFDFNELTIARARAIAETMAVPQGGRILDYGCGLGALTAGFRELGYDALGIDASSEAVEHTIPQARGYTRHVDSKALFAFDEGRFDLVVAKDVFEHIDEDDIHDITDRLLNIGDQILAIIPVVGPDRKFVFPLYENDPTHITRLTRREWRGRFAYPVAQEYEDLTPKVRRPDKVEGTICLRLAEPNQELIAWARTTKKSRLWRWSKKRNAA